MFERLMQRAEQRAAAVVQDALEKAELAVAELSGVDARREDSQVIVAGRGLTRRWLSDIRFRLALWMPR